MDSEQLKKIEQFNAILNKEPNKYELQVNKAAANTMYLPISFLETTLDELYFGLWKTDGFTTRVVGNEICGELNLHVFHPIAGVWITRTGAAATMIRQMKDAGVMEADKKIKNALEMDYPHLKADCFRNACLSLGKTFGRDLNRKFVDTYKAMLSGLNSGKQEQPPEKKLPEILPNTNDWTQAVKYLIKYPDKMQEAIEGFRTKRHISDLNAGLLINEANNLINKQ